MRQKKQKCLRSRFKHLLAYDIILILFHTEMDKVSIVNINFGGIMWKERLWQVCLVAILGLSMSMCSKSGDTTKLANASLSEISQTMICTGFSNASGVTTYTSCDASDDTSLTSGSITHDSALTAGWKLVGPGCGGGHSSTICFLFHK